MPTPTFYGSNRSPAIPFYRTEWLFGIIPLPISRSVYWSDAKYTSESWISYLMNGDTGQSTVSLNRNGTERTISHTNGSFTTQRIVSETSYNTVTDMGTPEIRRAVTVHENVVGSGVWSSVIYSDDPPDICAEWSREIDDMIR
jgi:hypothetical protein